jgi:TctA family transporter
VVLASGSLLKAIAMIVLGLLLGLVGTDVNSGVARFSFDIPELTDGIGFIVIAMGVFGYGEIIQNLSIKEEHREVFTGKVTHLYPSAEDFKRMVPAVLRGTTIGSLLGILPGGGALLAAFAAYTIEKKTKLKPGEVPFGQGNIRGVAAPRICQQRRLADLVHSPADAGHSAQRRDGAHGRCHDHPQHPAGPAGHDQQPGTVLGPDRLDVGSAT